MLDVSRWLEYHKKKGPNEYATAQRAASSMLGFGQGTMNTLAMGPEALEKHLKAMEKYAPTDEEIKRFQDLQEAMSKATTAVEALGRSIIALLTPSLIKFIDTWKDIIDTFREKGFVAGVRRYNQAMRESNAENVQTVRGWGSRVYNWGRRKLGLSGDEAPNDKPATFNERWSGTGGKPGSVGDAAPSDVLEKAKEVALSGGPDAVASFMARQGYPKNGAWCGEFAAATVKAAGGTPPKNPQIASNWRNYGREVSDPRPGDIAVRRGAPTGSTGSHVTIVEELNQRGFVGLGGNQGGGMHSQFPRASYQYYRGEAPPIAKLGGAAAAARVEQSTVNNSNRSSETHVGEIKVRVPPGTDGKGIAQEVTESLRRLEPAHERQD
jgi:hypothetical protein